MASQSDIKIAYFSAALILSVALTGCSAQVKLTQPATDLPAQFSISGQYTQQPQWWHAFDDALLDQHIESALTDNFSLKAAIARTRQAEALATKAGSSLMPSVQMSADGGKTFRSGSDGETVQLGLKASYELDLWSRLEAVETMAELDYLASREDVEIAALTLSANVADRWYALLTQAELVNLYGDQMETLTRQLAIIELGFQNGLRDSEDVLQQKQQIENLSARLQIAQIEQKIIQQQLALLLGQAQFPELNLPKTLPEISPIPATGLPAELASRRPDLKQAWLELQSRQQGLVVAEADRLPQVQLSASLLSASDDFSVLIDDWATNLAVSLMAPVFDGGQRKAEVVRQQAAVDESIHLYSQKVLEAFSDIETALLRDQSQQDQGASISEQLSLAKQAEAIKWVRYRNGDIRFLDVLAAQRSRLDLEQQQLQSRGQLLASRITLHRAIAGGLNYNDSVFTRTANDTRTNNNLSGGTL